MYFRVKCTGAYAYLQIVESFREQGQVHQRVLSTVGRVDVLQASGQLDALMRSGLRFCEKLAVIDAHAAGHTEPVQVQRVGPDLVFGRLWEALQLGTIIKRALESRHYEFDVERAIYLTVIHRLFAAGSDRAAERWRQAYRLSTNQEYAPTACPSVKTIVTARATVSGASKIMPTKARTHPGKPAM